MRQGVQVRLIYDRGEKPQSASGIDRNGGDCAPLDTHDRVEELGLPPSSIRGVGSYRGLMHHKYVVRDREAVWTGSLNITDDSMRRMDNTVLTLQSEQLADLYTRDFEQIWTKQSIEVTGAFRTDPDSLRFAGRTTMTDVDFSPGQGEQINEWVAAKVHRARRRIVICSMLINSSKLLNALTSQLDRGEVDLSGVYDHTQMAGVLSQWDDQPELEWKVEAVKRVVQEGRLVGKRSLPYRAGESHNFMHNKTVVVDDTVITGSYNLSHSAQANAENMLAIQNPELAEEVIAYTRHLARKYERG
jgi:phosphatidylserine/phosphatidylglycerophosphate/cardiolipin synthase-like enzyme